MTPPPRWRIACGLGLLLAVLADANTMAQTDVETVIPDLSAQGPKLRIHMGQVAHGMPALSTALPSIPGPVSPWYVAQWQQDAYITPNDLAADNPATRDPRLGVAAYALTAPDRHAHVWIYRAGGGWTYQLFERNGMLTGGGGANLFLSTASTDPDASFDRTMTYTLDAKITAAAIRYDTATALPTGAVLAQAFTGFGLMFHDPADNKLQFVFMQLPITLSRPISPGPAFICSLSGGHPSLLFSPRFEAGETVLPFRADAGPPHFLRYVLNDYVRRLVAAGYPCGGQMLTWPPAAQDLRNWRLTGTYIGLETENRDQRSAAATHAPQGSVSIGLQIANVQVVRGPN